MIGPIKRYTSYSKLNEDSAGYLVLNTDHLASHAFDDAVERELCNVAMLEKNEQLEINGFQPLTLWQEHAFTAGWMRCAKSRAKRAGGAQ